MSQARINSEESRSTQCPVVERCSSGSMEFWVPEYNIPGNRRLSAKAESRGTQESLTGATLTRVANTGGMPSMRPFSGASCTARHGLTPSRLDSPCGL